MTNLYIGTHLVLNETFNVTGRIKEVDATTVTVILDPTPYPHCYMPGSPCKVQDAQGRSIPKAEAERLREAYSSGDDSYPIHFRYCPWNTEDYSTQRALLEDLGYIVYPDCTDVHMLSNIANVKVVDNYTPSVTHMAGKAFRCKTPRELYIVASYGKEGAPQLYIRYDEVGSEPTLEFSCESDPNYRRATISEVLSYLCRVRGEYDDTVEGTVKEPESAPTEDSVSEICCPEGFVGTELRLPLGDSSVVTTIESVLGASAYFRIKGVDPAVHPDIRVVEETKGTALCQMPLGKALSYERYNDNGYSPSATCIVPRGKIEEYRNLLEEIGYNVTGSVAEGENAVFTIRDYNHTLTCFIAQTPKAEEYLYCDNNWELFHAISLLGSVCAVPYTKDATGRIYTPNEVTDQPTRPLCIHELIELFKRKNAKKDALRKYACKDCGRDLRAPGEEFGVWDEVWKAAGADPKDHLCADCLGKRLGRPLSIHDLRRVYKDGMNGANYKVGMLMPANAEFAYAKGWIHE